MLKRIAVNYFFNNSVIKMLGKLLNREIKEYPIPKHMNEEWKKDQVVIDPKEIAWFNIRWRELQNRLKKKERK